VVLASIATRDGAVDEDKDGSDGVGELLNLGRDILPVVLILLDAFSLCEPWRIDDANQCAAFAGKFIKAGLVGLTMTNGTTLLVGVVKDIEVVVVNVVADKNIGDEFRD
jgi:hypothetical protein